MQRGFHPIRPCLLLWGLLPLLFGSCSFGDEPSPCPYDVRLEYWYAGSGVENMLPPLRLPVDAVYLRRGGAVGIDLCPDG